MDLQEKRELVDAIFAQSHAAIVARLHRTPENWDGHELRVWIADDMESQVADMSIIRQQPAGRRAKDYLNALVMESL